MNMIRSFDLGGFQLRDDGRTVVGRMFPFNEVAAVADPGSGIYNEEFLPGCLTRLCQVARQRGNAAFIGLDLDHAESFDRQIGYAKEIEQRDDGGWAAFRLYNSPDLPKIQSMLQESHTGLSVNFSDVSKPRIEGGITRRTQIHVHKVAATPMPSYAGARIVSLRSDEEPQGLIAPNFDEVRAWLRSINPEGVSDFDDIDLTVFHPGDCCPPA